MHIPTVDISLQSGYDSDKSGSDGEEDEDDSDAILWRFCLSQLKTFEDTRHPTAQAQGMNGQERSTNGDAVYFGPIRKPSTLSLSQRRSILSAILADRSLLKISRDNAEHRLSIDDIHSRCFKTPHCILQDGTKVISTSMARSNANRDASVVRYISRSGRIVFGSVVFFFEYGDEDVDHNYFKMKCSERGDTRLNKFAFIRHMRHEVVQGVGQGLCYKSYNFGQPDTYQVIKISLILELVGMVHSNGRDYFSGRYTAFFKNDNVI